MKKIIFLAGLILGIAMVPIAAYFYFASGFAPVATSAPPMPFEKMLAHKALDARLGKEAPPRAAIDPTEDNLVAGARVYKQHCAMCHGLPGGPTSAVADGMFPQPPQLFRGKGVTDDPPGETWWKAANGIRMSGMPSFRRTLSDDQLWQVSWLLARANALPPAVQVVLTNKEPVGTLSLQPQRGTRY